MALSSEPRPDHLDLEELDSDDDDVIDLTDRRRVLLRTVFGVDASSTEIEVVFGEPEDDAPSQA